MTLGFNSTNATDTLSSNALTCVLQTHMMLSGMTQHDDEPTLNIKAKDALHDSPQMDRGDGTGNKGTICRERF